MRSHKFSTCVLAFILLVITTLTTYTQDVSADIGPKPSIRVTLENAPSDYYIALLKPAKEEKTNSSLSLDQVDDKSVNAYLKSFYYEGWEWYEQPVLLNVFRNGGESNTHRFGYMVPTFFRVIVIASDGTVFISNEVERQEFNAVFTYDVATGTLTEKLQNTVVKRWLKVAICFVLTLVIEFIVLVLFGYPKTKRNILSVLAANAITNIPMNIYLMWFYNWNPRNMIEPFFVILILEVYVFLVEIFFYRAFLKDKDGKKDTSKNIHYALAANAASLVIGFIIPYV